jgi:hypothetical protein
MRDECKSLVRQTYPRPCWQDFLFLLRVMCRKIQSGAGEISKRPSLSKNVRISDLGRDQTSRARSGSQRRFSWRDRTRLRLPHVP